ncbi:MAG: hypothetical protein IJE60_09990 [Tyzzerella sp.]|nr:hypothetical protein [Tyzzerella sp.]
MNLGNNQYKPISFWSWNGDMNEIEVRSQVRDFKEKGFGGFFIHSRAGRLISYMGDKWIQACEAAVDEAEKVGLFAWLYDEDGWPSGFGGGLVNGCGEEYCSKKLRFSTGVPTEQGAQVLAVYHRNLVGEYVRIDAKDATDADLYCYYALNVHYVDTMDKKVTEKFIEVTHEVYKKHLGRYFGNTIKGIFTDEPQMADNPCWSPALIEKYREKYNRDLLDELYLLYVNTKGYQAFRYRFWSCANELFRDHYVKPINEWCNANNLLMTGHFGCEEMLCEQALANGGVMPFYSHMGLPGIDHLGNRYAPATLMKQVTSVAHQRDIPLVLSESFGCAGWDISFKDLLGIAGWQAVFGVNQLCTHLSAYSITGRRKRDYPAFFSYQEPWWEDTGVLFGAIEKLNREIATSVRETKVAVLHPIRSLWCKACVWDRLQSRFLTAQFRELVENLLDIHVDFDLLDEGEMETAKLEEDKLCVGVLAYSMIIVPEALTLSAATVTMLKSFAEAGGKVIFMNGRPRSAEGDETHPLAGQIHQISAEELQNTRYILQKYFRRNPIQNAIRLFDQRMENEVSGLISHYGKVQNGAVVYLFNHMSGNDITTILRHEGRCRVEIVSLTDDVTKDITQSIQKDYTYAQLTIESGTGVLLRITYEEETHAVCVKPQMETKLLRIHEVQPTDDNCITLDCGRYRIDEEEYSEYKAVIHMADEIYNCISGKQKDSKVCIEYPFYADFEHMPSELTLAVEKSEFLKIELNNVPVTKELNWWIDKGIVKYDITGLVANGKNTVLLTYMIPSTNQKNTLEGKFETEHNRFFYEIEPESIYICGQFDVKCNAEMAHSPCCHTAECDILSEQTFTLVDATEKTSGDLTSQGMWFYRGDCAFAGELDYDGSKEMHVKVDAINCIHAKVYVNKNYAGILICDSDEVDITPYLQTGTNEITVVAGGHNRNLMGPHHHVRGQLHFVAPGSFTGHKSLGDVTTPEIKSGNVWTNHYSFAPFGINKIEIVTVEK